MNKAELLHRVHKLSQSLQEAQESLNSLLPLMRKGCPEDVEALLWDEIQDSVHTLHKAVEQTYKLLPVASHLGGAYRGRVVGYDTHCAAGTILLDEGSMVSFALTAFYPLRGSGGPHVGNDVRVLFQNHGSPGIVLAVEQLRDQNR